ncbi:hypothetical protein N7513_001933 [Penicillium frequentans]|nr:hypothetical protein N7513_001917 [Penicillium glabrum]KAJ5559534.1 hypothetical protein N7513_001933 [Penicillium glabrum]
MVHYVHVIGRQHGITSSNIDDHIERLEKTIRFALPKGSKWHGMYHHQIRKRVHPSWFRKELIFTFAGQKGLKRLEEIWCQTWIFVINLRIEGDFEDGLVPTLLGLDMTVERVGFTDGRRLDELTRCMLQLRNEIPHPDNGKATEVHPESRGYFGEWFDIGRHI